MKAADIPDEALIELVRECVEARCTYPMDAGWHGGRPGYLYDPSAPPRKHWASRIDLEGKFPAVPPKVILAKLRGLIKRNLLTGCGCGCRGNFELPEDATPLVREAIERSRQEGGPA